MNLQELYAEAMQIRAAAEARPSGMLTPQEANRLDQILAQFQGTEAFETLDRLAQPGCRLTEPDIPGRGGPGGDMRPPSARQPEDAGEVYALTDGTRIKAYLPNERLSDASPPSRTPFNMARFMAAIRSGNWRHAQPEYQVMAQQSGLVGSAGQFMVPEPVSREIIDLARAQSRAIQAGVRTIPMESSTLRVARVANDLTPHWRAENVGIQDSSVTFEQVELQAKTVGAIVVSSEELLQDAPNADALLRQLLAEALGAEIDRSILVGDLGSPQTGPAGIISSGLVSGTASIGTIASYRPIVDALQVLWAANGMPDTIIHSTGAAHAFAALQDQNGQPMAQPRAVAQLRELVSNRLPATGSPEGYTSIIGGFSEVVLGMRLPLELAVANTGPTDESGYDAFSKYQLRFRMVARLDVAIFRPSLLRILNDIQAPAEVTGS